MSKRLLGAIVVASAWGLTAGYASAAETIKFRFVTHNVGVLTMDAADGVEGHIMGAAKFSGIITLEDGTSGIVTYLANIDYVKGSGTYTIYETFKFDNGSVLRLKGGGPAKLNGAKTEFPEGNSTILGGEGKYKGVSGNIESIGERLAPFADGGDTLENGVIHLN